MTVGISMPTLESKNTQDVSAELIRELNNMGHEVDMQSAEGNIQTQISQLQNMIETCDVLIVWAVDGSAIEDVMQQAKEHGLTVISFDERICSELVSYYIGFDYFQAGRLQGQYIVDRYEASGATEPQNIVVFKSDSRLCLEVFAGAMEVLQPYIDDGRFLCSEHSLSSDMDLQDAATETMTEILMASDYDPYANNRFSILGTVNPIASGVIVAFLAAGNDSSNMPIITGFGNESETVALIHRGLQSMTVNMDYITLSRIAARVADAVLKGESPDPIDTEIDYGFGRIPSALVEPKLYDPTADQEVDHITITRIPSKIFYFEGEKFSTSGMEVVAYLKNGSSYIVTDYDYSPKEELSLSDKEIEISYMGKTARLSITVKENTLAGITVTKQPFQMKQVEGFPFDMAGLEVTAEYSDGFQRVVSHEKLSIQPDLLKANLPVVISYKQGKITKECEIDGFMVEPRVLTGLRIARRPNKITYYVREELDTEGIIVEAQYSNLRWVEIPMESVTLNPTELKSNTKYFEISYTENSITKTARQEITVSSRRLTSIAVTTPPDTLVYLSGGSFHKDGMVVTAYYEEGEPRELDDEEYRCYPHYLDVSVEKIKISYHEGSMKETELKITVLQDGLDRYQTNQSELDYACSAGGASVNLYNGRMRFAHSDIGIGVNSYQIEVGHVYNSVFHERALRYQKGSYDYLKTGLGVGFKLNVQQYLLPSNSDFIYVDGKSCKHYFKPLYDGHRYYDTDGLGLILDTASGEKIISDEQGNKMYFDDIGRLIKTVSCHNQYIVKHYDYDEDGRLVSIYDGRNPDDRLELDYDGNTGLLTQIRCIEDNLEKRSVQYEYATQGDEHRLVKISDEKGSTVFTYTDKNLVNGIMSLPDQTALDFDYENYKVISAASGRSDSDSETQDKISISWGRLRNRNLISYGTDIKQTVVTKQNQGPTSVKMVYQFDSQGNTTAIFEANNGDVNDLRALEKRPGVALSLSAPSSQGYFFNRILNCNNLDELNRYRENKYSKYYNFNVNFWIKLCAAAEAKVKIRIKSDKNYNDYGEAVLDSEAREVWQYVSVPIRISGSKVELIEITVEDEYNHNTFYISDARLCYSPNVKFCLTNGETWMPLNEATQIKYRLEPESTEYGKNIGKYFYMSEKDIQATYLSRFKARGLSQRSREKFILSLCDGRDKMLVSSVALSNGSQDYSITFGNDEYGDGTGTRAQYFYETQSPDGNLYTYSIPHFLYGESDENIDCDCMMIVTEANQYIKSATDHKESYTKTYIDLKGNVRCEIDEYGVVTKYEYDQDGALSKKIISHPSTNETIVYQATQTEHSRTEATATSHMTVNYDKAYGRVNETAYRGNHATDGLLTTSYGYDEQGRLSSVRNNLGAENTLSYDEHGRLYEVKPKGSGYGYREEYNDLGDPIRQFLVNSETNAAKLLSWKKILYTEGKMTTEEYREAGRPDKVEVTYDKYGRTSQIVETSYGESPKTTTFQRQTLTESAGAAEVTAMYDPYEERTYQYSYDEFNQCTGYTASAESGNFSIKRESPERVTYGVENTMRYSDKKYDGGKLLSPRVNITSDCGKRVGTESEPDFVYEPGGVRYSYDELGRIKSKQIYTEHDEGKSFLKEYEYVPGTLLKKKVKVTDKTIKYEESFEHSYDTRGRIIKESGEVIGGADYTYDDGDRLTSEVVRMGNSSYTQNYGYHQDGSIAWEQREGGARINYEYELGRLVKRGTSSYAYDNLGNCTNYNGTSLTWHRGKLLKKYGTTSYSYDNQGVRSRKERGAEIIKYYHDGGKLIDEVRQKGNEKTVIEYLYDIEGLMGMKIGRTEYHYLKDGKGNVRALLKAERLEYEDKLIARYDYDAWGNCVVKNGDGTINTDEEFIGNINPIRWKSQYYDTESGLYYIDGRYYSPVTKQYLSMENVESLIANAGSVYGLNGYLLTLTNPVNMVYNGYTIETNTELAYEAPEQSAWQLFWGSTLGKAVAIGLVWLAAVVSMATGNIGGFLAAMGITVCSLALGGVISGCQSWRQGNGFWRGFDNYINCNWSQSFAITATLVVIDCGIRTVAAVISNAGSKTAPANTVKNVDEVPIDVKETVVYGKAHGSVEHQAKINEITGDMLKSNKYSEIYLNRSLKTAGLNGGQRPDIIGKAKDGTVIAYEVASKTQTTGSYAGRKLLKKIELMQLNNPMVNFDLIWLFG